MSYEKMTNLRKQLEHEQKTATQWINLYKDSHPKDVCFWQGYLKAVDKLLTLKTK